MLFNAINENLNQTTQLLEQLTDHEYSKKLAVLNNASIGMHVRHIIEFFQCLVIAIDSGTVNYDQRKRNCLLETDTEYCREQIESISTFFKQINSDKDLTLICDYSKEAFNSETMKIKTSVLRELHYNLEHSIHHMALIRIGVNALDHKIVLDSGFGVAASTLRNRKLCAQ